MRTERRERLEGIRWMLTGLLASGSRSRLTAADWLLEDPIWNQRSLPSATRRPRLIPEPA
jgi:hypothetical protein